MISVLMLENPDLCILQMIINKMQACFTEITNINKSAKHYLEHINIHVTQNIFTDLSTNFRVIKVPVSLEFWFWGDPFVNIWITDCTFKGRSHATCSIKINILIDYINSS